MAGLIDMVNRSEVTGTGAVQMEDNDGGDAGDLLTKIPTRGHFHWTLTAIEDANGTATVELRGTNNPSNSSTDGEVLVTLSNTGNDQEDGSASSKGYKYVFVFVSAASDPSFDAEDILLHGTGYSG